MDDDDFFKLCQSMEQMNEIILSEKDFKKFLYMCDSDTEPNEGLKKLLEDYKNGYTKNTNGDK